MNNVGLPLESTETHQVDFSATVKEEAEDEEYGHMPPCSLQNEDTKNFSVFQCKTETGITEFNIVQNETLPLQATVEAEIKKEEDDPQFGNPESVVQSEANSSPPVLEAVVQLKRVSVVLVDCFRSTRSGPRGKEEEKTQTPTQTSRDAQLTPDTLERAPTSVTTATTSSAASNSQNDSPVALEGWVKAWEEPNGIPAADVPWLRDDCESGLFTPLQTYRDAVTGEIKKRRVLKSDRMWFHPPEPPYNLGNRGDGGSGVPMPEAFFRSRVFFWRPVGVWGCALKCPRGDACAGAGGHTHLSTSGYHSQVLSICDLTDWYTMLTEVLSCGPCLEEAHHSGDHENESEDDDLGRHTGRWLAWDDAILRQLNPAHRSMFPAVLTARCGVDKGVLDLLRNWKQGNTNIESDVDRVWRRLQENHLEKYKHRWDLYTTVLQLRASKQQQQPRNVLSALGDGEFRNPLPPLREIPCTRLLSRAFLLGEAGRVQDCRSRILSTFGSVLKMDFSKMMAKSASLEGGDSAKWFTCITNELSQIVTFVLTCEEVESVEKLLPMCQGLMERFRRAEKPAPRILYVDWGCCGVQGPETAIETLFQPWVNDGRMVVRLDISDWIRRFDDALRTNSHSKCATFVSALTEAVLEYERQDLDLLIAAVRAGDAVAMETLSDEDVVQRYVSGEQLRRHVRRVTRGVKETLRLVQLALEEMKGPSGLDGNGVSLFKSSVTIDELWARQQRHLECLQDPPGVSLYQVTGYTSINGVDVPFYTCLRERISLERFHCSLHRMIPGSQSAAQPYQVHLLGGIARWNADRTSEFLFGNEEGPQEMVHSVTPPLSSLTTHHPATHQRCSEPVVSEEPADRKVSSAQFRCCPAGVQCDDELLGLEYLLRERTGDSSVFFLVGLTGNILDEEEEEDAEEEEDESDVDEAYLSDEKPSMDEMDVSRITLICSETTTAVVQPPALAKRTPNTATSTATSTSLATIPRSVPPAASNSSLSPSLQPKLHISALAPLLPNSHTPLLPLQSRRTTDTATFTITTNKPSPIAVSQTATALSSVQPPMVVLAQLKTPDNSTSTMNRPAQSDAAPSTVQLVMVPLVQPKSSDLSTLTRPVPTAALQSIASSSAPFVSPVQPSTPDIATTTITIPTATLQSALSPTQLAMVSPLQPNTTNIATTTITKPVPTTASVHPKTRNTTTTITRPQLHSRPALPPLLPSSAAPPPPQPGPESGSGSGSSRALPPMLPQASWSRSTIYKRKQVGRPAELRAKQSRIKHPPTCKACGQLIQGHLKHKKKTFCPDKNISPSQGLDNRVYRNFEHFVSVVDGLED